MYFNYISGLLIMRLRWRPLGLLVAALLLSFGALAQRPAALRGTVADSLSGRPLPGVSIGLVGQPGVPPPMPWGSFAWWAWRRVPAKCG
ncbi:hypothetical protein GKZ68_09920 [Hymenobacter sp. BRD128]|uniref:hypothetical protein n=1 Tax=Hymenobacter sp. BRD128 TaxID=2675878 RepID=UPI0015637699|nr:hypothetical protein [Hymenobacter sp. BRD128]QKG56916.1 hypothetical protein GKZ68_09920 [Hymenobacter sp. BRD128]